MLKFRPKIFILQYNFLKKLYINNFFYKLILFLLINSVYQISLSQFFNSGNEHFKIKWYYIKSDKFKIIFPETLDSIAYKTLNYLHYYSNILDTIYNVKNLHFPIIIHKNSVISNGFVTYGPKRSEFFIFPYPFNFPGSDLKLLSSHELVHMYQTIKMKNGFTKFLSYICGDGSLGYTFLNIPYWFLEGEAVYFETTLNNTGRGRLSIFKDEFKTYILENKSTNYDKTYFGSYKNYVPSVYHLGYYMVDYLYQRHINKLGSEILFNTGKKSFIPFYFNYYTKKITGKSIIQIFKDIKDSIIKENVNKNFDTIYSLNINNKKYNKDYLSIYSINVINNSKILAIKKEFDKIPEIVEYNINTNKINIVYKSNNIYPDYLNANNEYIVWSEVKPHYRYELLNYSIIKLYEIKTKKIFTINNKSKYIFPYLSKTSNYLIFIEIDEQLNKYLTIYDLKNNKIIDKIKSINNAELQFPIIDNNDENIFVISNSDSGKCIYRYNLNNKLWNKVFGPTFYDISYISVYKNYILFNSNYTTHENIYLFDIKSNTLYQVTNNKLSSRNPVIINDTLYFTYLTNKGWKIGLKFLNENEFIKIPLYLFYSKNNNENNCYNNLNNNIIKPQRYNKLTDLLKFHTWLPLYIDAFDLESTNIKPGISLFSQNYLNTLMLQLSIYRDFNKNYFYTHFNYSELPLILDCEIKYGGNQKKIFNIEPETLKKDLNVRFSFSYPLNFSSNIYNRYITPSFQLYYRNIYFKNKDVGALFNKYSIAISNYKSLSYRNIYPEIGFIMQETFINSLNQKQYYNYLNAFIFNLFIPGFYKNHAFKINFSHQLNPVKYHTINNIKYSIFLPFTIVNYPDTYLDYIYEIKSNENIKVYIEYLMPLLYPDINIPGIIFMKRIKTKFSFNYFQSNKAYVYFNNNSIKYFNTLYLKSLDLQFIFDTHLLRLYIPFELKYAISYLFKYNTIDTKFGISANFSF